MMHPRRSLRNVLLAALVTSALLAIPSSALAGNIGIKCSKWEEHHYYIYDPHGPDVNGSVFVRSCIQRSRSVDAGRTFVTGFVNVRTSGQIELYESKSKGSGSIWNSSGQRILGPTSSKYASSPTGIGRAWGTRALKVRSARKFFAEGTFTYDVKYDRQGTITAGGSPTPLY